VRVEEFDLQPKSVRNSTVDEVEHTTTVSNSVPDEPVDTDINDTDTNDTVAETNSTTSTDDKNGNDIPF